MMRKKRRFRLGACILAGALCFGIVGFRQSGANAATGAGDEVIPERMTVELDCSGTVLPLPVLDPQYTCIVEVYAGTDTEYQTPLASGVDTYVFPSTGEYLLRYRLILEGNVENTVYAGTRLTVEDTLAPEIEEKSYATDYTAGQSISLKPPAAYDRGDGEVAVTVELKKDGSAVSVSGETFTFTEAGSYELIFTARDSQGLEARTSYTFTVTGSSAPTEPEDDKGCGCGTVGLGGGILGGGLLILAGAGLVWFDRRKRA